MTAAESLGWGSPALADEFDGLLGGDWRVYSGTGFDGQGTRTAEALSVSEGVLTITGDAEGNTGGMAWSTGQEYGRWEARVRTPAGDPSYNPVLLLWPDDPAAAGQEIDFLEVLDPTRQTANAFVHPGGGSAAEAGEVAVDGTAWHTWAVEWTPTSVTTYVDGTEWWRLDDPALLPSGPMHLCVQLDWFPTAG
ncbi:glycoside hydrolase family 16 protein, partial [Pseudonocardia oceani]